MFSGIITAICLVESAKNTVSGLSLQLKLENKQLIGLEIGASVSVNGVCLTATGIKNGPDSYGFVSFDLVPETLKRSNLSGLSAGALVNVERSLKFGDEVGGHLCSGHVDGLATVVRITALGQGAEIDFDVDQELLKFILEKGYVALNGASLTVAKKLSSGFRVAFIPETMAKTNLGVLTVGSEVNLEIDRSTQAIVETVERLLSGRTS